MLCSFNIFGIDPGKNTGIAIINVNIDNLTINNIETVRLKLDKTTYEYDFDFINNIFYLKEYLNKMLINYNPVAIGYETAFLNTKFPNAIGQLSQYTCILDMVSREYNPFIKIYRYAPMLAKSLFNKSVGGKADKNDMLEALKSNIELNSFVNLDKISEHEVDAVAMAYITLQKIRSNPMKLFVIKKKKKKIL